MSMRFALAIFLYHACCDGKTYENYTLFRGIPTTEKQLQFFNNLSRMYDVVYWRRAGLINRPVEFTIGPTELSEFLEAAMNNRIPLVTLIEDVQSAFDKQTVKTYIRRKLHSFNWFSYYRLNDIYNWLEDLAKKFPTELQLTTIGKTNEKRNIFAVKLRLKGCDSSSKVIIEGGIHAREWVAPAFVTYMLNEMVHAASSKDKELYKIAKAYEWYFIPMTNPDGYEFTHTNNRLWRKNRRDGYGIDLNRNFGIAFGTVGVNVYNKYDETYCGPAAFSEPEAQALAEFVKENSDHMDYYIAFHAYGQYFIVPYSYTTQYFENYHELLSMGTHASTRISKKYGTRYTVGNAHKSVGYLASGSSTDWVKKTFKTRYVATLELRDTGKYGFALPPEQILPTCKETMDGMIALFSPQPALKLREPSSGWRKSVFDGIIVYCFCICLL